MTSEEIRQKFLEYFERNGHTVRPSSSLVPEDDASVLFTTAGMQQFKPYYVGEKDPISDFGGFNTVSVQKCVRTSDINEVGDDTHLTFFEMLGNFSFGDGAYFKEEAIKYGFEFIREEMGLSIDYVSIFHGENGIPRDEDSARIWKSLDENIEIREFGKADNFWGPTGDEGPCGPTTEIYVNGVEVWNIVFNEYYHDKDKNLSPLRHKGVDTGMGLERLLTQKNGKKSFYDTDLFADLLRDSSLLTPEAVGQRVIADHMRAAVFMIADGVIPTNTDRGYILRRLLRRGVIKMKERRLPHEIIDTICEKYGSAYPNLISGKARIVSVIREEFDKFELTIEKGLKEFEKMKKNGISGKEAFVLFSTYGFPLELTLELAKDEGIEVDVNAFYEEEKKHQEVSRTASRGMFKGGLQSHGEMSIKYHTATHLLLAALRAILGPHIEQRGSNINDERLRLDFSHPDKMTDEEKKEVEDWVNNAIMEDLNVSWSEMGVSEAKEKGAIGVFDDKYGEKVKVYAIGRDDNFVSIEICGGPHVECTGTMGKFKILKEEAVSQGVRRVKAILT